MYNHYEGIQARLMGKNTKQKRAERNTNYVELSQRRNIIILKCYCELSGGEEEAARRKTADGEKSSTTKKKKQ